MLTRLRVDGFKNLVGFDASFGAFTCIAGENGVGKSNIFDAIQFLADGPSDLPLGEHLASLCVERGVQLVLTSVDPHRVPSTGRSVEDRLRYLVEEGDGFDVAFVHRDAEAGSPEGRRSEIAAVTKLKAWRQLETDLEGALASLHA